MEREVTWEELAQHNRTGDAWLAVRGGVYDVSEWLEKHPGGRDVLLLNAGRDATALFESYHLFGEDAADKALARLRIGRLSRSEFPAFRTYRGPFYTEVRKRVREALRANGGPRTPWGLLAIGVSLFVLLGVFYALAVMALSEGYGILGAILASLAGWAAAMVSLIPVHEGSHFALGRWPWGWRLLGAMHDFGNGASFYNWLHQHFLGHHPYTNVEHIDPDVLTNDPDVRRIKNSQPSRMYYRFQHLYAPVLYGLLAVKFRVNDLTQWYSTRANGAIRMNPAEPWHSFAFVAGKVVFVLHRFVVPAFFLGPVYALALAFWTDLVTSYYLALAFQVSHIVPQAHWPIVADSSDPPRFDMDWAEAQVRSTIDYAHDSRATTFLTGALNYQAVHHLFPGVSQAFYPLIGPIVRDTAKQFNVPYVIVPNFMDALSYHFSYLKVMGLGNPPKLD